MKIKLQRMGKPTTVGSMLYLSGFEMPKNQIRNWDLEGTVKSNIIRYGPPVGVAVATQLVAKRWWLSLATGIATYFVMKPKTTGTSTGTVAETGVVVPSTSDIEPPRLPDAEMVYSLPDDKTIVGSAGEQPGVNPYPEAPPMGITAGLGSAGAGLLQTIKEVVGLVPTPPLYPSRTITPIRLRPVKIKSYWDQFMAVFRDSGTGVAQTPVTRNLYPNLVTSPKPTTSVSVITSTRPKPISLINSSWDAAQTMITATKDAIVSSVSSSPTTTKQSVPINTGITITSPTTTKASISSGIVQSTVDAILPTKTTTLSKIVTSPTYESPPIINKETFASAVMGYCNCPSLCKC